MAIKGNVIYGNIDRFTGESFNTKITSVWHDGSAMNDSKVDNVIYFKNKTEFGGYSKRSFSGPINVKWFGAKGDSVTNDTAALKLAASIISEGEGLYFPKGTYIVINETILFRGKDRLTIYGDGADVSIIKPLVQGVSPTLVRYPCTVAIDQCTNIIISNLTIEAKGQSFGDADSITEPYGDLRTNATINGAGSALLICRSDNVECINLKGRRCGSVSVFYVSSAGKVRFINCFGNARTIGYAGFCGDNWVDNTNTNLKRDWSFINCSSYAEVTGEYAGKTGILIEGDNGKALMPNIIIENGRFSDMRGNSGAKHEGTAFHLVDCENAIVRNVTGTNNDASAYLAVRGDVDFETNYVIESCTFVDNLVMGFNLYQQSTGLNGTMSNFIFNNINQTVREISRWAADSSWGPASTVFKYLNSTAVNFNFYNRNSNPTIFNNFNSTGSKHGVRIQDGSSIEFLSGYIYCKEYNFIIQGGNVHLKGTFKNKNGSMVYANTDNILEDGTSNATLPVSIILKDSNINLNEGSALFNFIGNTALLTRFVTKGNSVLNGYSNLLKSTFSTPYIDVESFQARQSVVVTAVSYSGDFATQLTVKGYTHKPNFESPFADIPFPSTNEMLTGVVDNDGNCISTIIKIYGTDRTSSFPVGSIVPISFKGVFR